MTTITEINQMGAQNLNPGCGCGCIPLPLNWSKMKTKFLQGRFFRPVDLGKKD